MAETTKFDPTATSEVYDWQKSEWELNQDFGEMHLNTLRDGTYLDAFGAGSEPTAQYLLRKNMSFAMDHAQDLIYIRVDNIFRKPPVRKYEKSPFSDFIEEFLADVDGGGTSMDAFMRKALVGYYTNGVDIVVDKTASDVEPENAAQEAELGIKPFLHAFGPLERLDWGIDHADQYEWVRYVLGCIDSGDEFATDDTECQYLTMTRDGWRLYTTSTNGKSDTMVEEGTHVLEDVPVVTFYFKESIKPSLPKVPLSLLTRISPIARYLLNLISQYQIDTYRNIAFLVATGVQADQIPTEITPMGCWALPDGAQLNDVSGEVDHIVEKREFIAVLIQAILRIGKMAGHSGEIQARATSGTQVAVERTDLDNEMRMTASQCEEVEKEVMRIAVSRFEGREVTAEELAYDVDYNKNFVLTGADELVASLKAFVDTGMHIQVPEIASAMLRQILGALVNEDDEAFDKAMLEIKAMVPDEIVSRNETDEVDEVEGFE